ncbi:MAG: sigma-70 family RNA polymerase sigma factor [Gammaproteobacteria bacterium]|nr:sigma-70 family RNA polymerase sigma factor [Gammaproteobacteria bacterium]
MKQNVSDETLITALATGDEQAFEQLYLRYKSQLFFFLKVRCADPVLVNDIFQETWETVFRSVGRYTHRGQFRAWLYSIARSRLIDHYRRNKRHANQFEIDDDQSELADTNAIDPETQAELFGQTDLLLNYIEMLPESQKEALSLYVVGLTLTEIAEITATNRETVKSRIRYAKTRLLHAMQEATCLK